MTEGKTKLEQDFEAVLAQGREWYADPTKRALHASWWFIENVKQGDPGSTPVFFHLRNMVRAVL
jgi:hypothetical protein